VQTVIVPCFSRFRLSSWFHLSIFAVVRPEREQVRALAFCLKPVPQAMFLHALGALQML
jgi:hypothetical protein